jgi:hypothetical protein
MCDGHRVGARFGKIIRILCGGRRGNPGRRKEKHANRDESKDSALHLCFHYL